MEERSAGQTLGWSALIPPHRFTLKATAPIETDLLAFRRGPLLDYLAAHPEVGYPVTRNLAAVVGQRLQVFQAMWLREMQRVARDVRARRGAAHETGAARRSGSPCAAARVGVLPRCRRARPQASAATARRAAGGSPAAVLRRDLPVLRLPRGLKANRTRREAHRHAHRHRADARRGTPLVPRLPRRRRPRPAAPGERRAAAVRASRTACAASATARSYRDWRAGVHGRRTGDWNGHKAYLLCAQLPQPAPAALQAASPPKPAPGAPVGVSAE